MGFRLGILLPLLFSVLLQGVALESRADTLSIPIDSREGEAASNLLYNGKKLDSDQARSKADKEYTNPPVDISTLDPATTKIWLGKDAGPYLFSGYPGEGDTLAFNSLSSETEVINGVFRAKLSQGNQTFEMIASKTEAHAALMSARLLRKLGYPVIPPKHYSKLKITFRSLLERKQFTGETAEGADKKLNTKSLIFKTNSREEDWIVEKTDSPPTITIQDVVLEPGIPQYPQYHWGAMTQEHLLSQSGDPKSRLREISGLMLPVALLNTGEKPNLYSWELTHKYSNTLIFTHPFVQGFADPGGKPYITFDDLKWIARKMAKLSLSDWTEVVSASELPDDVQALVLQKLLARREQMLSVFDLDSSYPKINYVKNITIGQVKDGKLGPKENLKYPGHAEIFDDGDVESPVSDIFRYLKFEVHQSAIDQVIKYTQNQLKLKRDANDVAKDHAQHLKDLFSGCLNGTIDKSKCVDRNPLWGGMIGGIDYQTSRGIKAGSFYGSDSPVSLTDTLSASVNIGYFQTRDGLPRNIVAGLVANAQWGRHWIHLRPLTSLEEAEKAPYSELNIDGYMKGIATALDTEIHPASDPKEATDSLAYLSKLQPGEMFIITDTLSSGLTANVNWNIADLMNLSLLGASPKVSFQAGVQKAIVSRLTITRTQDQIQIYIQKINQESLNFSVDFNWWINILNYTHTHKKGFAKTEAYLLPSDLPLGEERTQLSLALHSLFARYGTAYLRNHFDPYLLRSDVDTVIDKGKIRIPLIKNFEWYSSETTALTEIKKFKDSDGDENGNPRYTPKWRNFVTNQLVRTNGSNVAALLAEVMGKYVKDLHVIPGNDGVGDNPADTFLGRGQSAIWSGARELTAGRDNQSYASASHSWAGWSIKKNDFLQLIKDVQRGIAPIVEREAGHKTPIIREDEFKDMGELMWFKVAQELRYCGEGAQMLADLFASPKIRSTKELDIVMAIRENLIALVGTAEFQKFINWNDLRPIDLGTDKAREEKAQYLYDVPVDWWNTEHIPVMPWMKEVLDAREYYKDLTPEMSERDRKGTMIRQAKWISRITRILESHIGLPRTLELLGINQKTGKANYYVSVKVTGFKTKDSLGYVDYYADDIGDDECINPIEAIAGSDKISSSILGAKYLSDGY